MPLPPHNSVSPGKGRALIQDTVFHGITAYAANNSEQLDNESGAIASNKQQFVDNLVTFLKKRSKYTRVGPNDDILQKMYEGDYWQNGTQWMGPLPENLPEELHYEIARYFASRNMIKECVDRHFDAIVGEDPRINTMVKRALKTTKKKDPTTGITSAVREKPEDAEQNKMEEYDAALTSWYDTYDMFTPFVEGLPPLLTRGACFYRLYIPYHLLEAEGQLPDAEDLADALSYIRLMQVDPANCRTVKTSTGDIIGAWFAYKEGNAQVTEIHYVDIVTKETVIATNISIGNKKSNDWPEVRLDLGGKLLIVELSRKFPFVTPQAMQLSNLLNVDFTVLGRNLTQAGFLERIITNAQMPGHLEPILDENGDPTGDEKWVAEPLYTGTGTSNVLAGIEIVDDNGEGTGKRADPKVYYRDPVDVTTFVNTDGMIREGIYAEFKQSHMMISSSSTTTGRSREQALNDFSASIRFTARIVNRALSQIFDTAMALASWMVGDEQYVKEYKTVVQARLSIKLLTPDEKRVIMEMYDKELLSAETAMLDMNHVSDPAAEFQLIDGESERRDAFLQRQIKAGGAFKLEGDGGGGQSANPNNPTPPKAANKPKSDNGVPKAK